MPIRATDEPVKLSEPSKSIIKTLLYFDIFTYPLNKNEINSYLPFELNGQLNKELSHLSTQNIIHKEDDFFHVSNDLNIIKKRLKGNTEAARIFPIARRHCSWLSLIPFIKCICISGSLSKSYMDEKSDIDYFIIAKKNRLWLVRAILTCIIKPLWLIGVKKYICPNYMVAENQLEIPDKNTFTAIEIATLVPVYNIGAYNDFLQANLWVKNYFPHFKKNTLLRPLPYRKYRTFRLTDPIFTLLDEKLFELYQKHYNRKFASGPQDMSEIKYNKNVYKMHRNNFRNRILDKYEENLRNFELKYGVSLL